MPAVVASFVSGDMELLRSQSAVKAFQQLFWVDRSGTVGARIGQRQVLMSGPVLSSDGGRVLVRAKAGPRAGIVLKVGEVL